MKNEEMDLLLAAWSANNALPASRAAAIREYALSTPPKRAPEGQMSPGWWKARFSGLAEVVRASADPRPFLYAHPSNA